MLLSGIALLLSYLLGSVSFSLVIAKGLGGIDIRKHGSGNAGATNTLRVLGVWPAIVVFILDAGKGIIAVFIGYLLSQENIWVGAFCGILAVIGHNWPIFFHFKGGKGVATTIGVMAFLAFKPSLIAGIVAILLIAITRYVSLGSLVFMVAVTIGIFWQFSWPVFLTALIFCLLSFYRHHSNLSKLIRGKENRLGRSKQGGKRVV